MKSFETARTFRRTALVLCICLMLTLCAFADSALTADQTGEAAQYTFCAQEFSVATDAQLEGIYVSSVPDESIALLCLGSRVIREGDVLPFADLDRLTLAPVTENGGMAVLTYLPLSDGGMGQTAQYTMKILATKNQPPEVHDQAFETYKNIANNGTLDVSDPESDPLTYAITVQPKRGTVELSQDGTFVYTPLHNKVGDDAFSYTVTDSAGNTSAPATVRIKITQPLDETTFADLGAQAQYSAMWMRQHELFGGELLAGKLCFVPQRTLSRGEFLAMCMKLADIDPEIGLVTSGFSDQDQAPTWMQPYLVSAMRRGIVEGEASETGLLFRPNDTVTVAEAAQMVSNTFGIGVDALTDDTSVATLSGDTMPTFGNEPLVRQTAAELLQKVPS